jgi:hypothetical protein
MRWRRRADPARPYICLLIILKVDSLGPAIVEGQDECRCRGLDVQIQSAGEGMDVGQVGGAGSGDPLLQARGVAQVRGEEGREVADEGGQGGHLGAGGLDAGDCLLLACGQAVWPGEQEPGGPAW